MSRSALYDDDILLWSEQQAEVIRALKRTARNLPNELDIDNVAEEIESVGRSELAAVESYIELILSHLIKLALEPELAPIRHWRSEVIAFHGNMRRRYTASMRDRIAYDEAWRLAREQAIERSDQPEQDAERLPAGCPIRLDEVLGDRIDITGLVNRFRS
jgi:hypothetical protein